LLFLSIAQVGHLAASAAEHCLVPLHQFPSRDVTESLWLAPNLGSCGLIRSVTLVLAALKHYPLSAVRSFPSLALRWLPLALIVAVALWLRTHALADRPMHADEANQAVKLGELLDTGRYTFDPRDHHGPTLYFLAAPIAWFRGETSLASLTETTVRLLPAVAGTLSVLLLALLAHSAAQAARPDPAPPNDARAAPAHPALLLFPLAAAAFLAISPPAVYYSRYFVQETLLVTFTLGAFVCGQRWWQRGGLTWALATGGCIGLMQATKDSAPLFLVAAVVALLVIRPARPRSTRIRRDLVAALLAALVVAAAFYSSFGKNLPGLRDAITTYSHASDRATAGTGHEKPWWYYLRLFGWHREGGLLWHQLAFTALALCGAALAFRRTDLTPDHTAEAPLGTNQHALLRRALIYAALVTLVLSVTPYKTPWHILHLVPALALLSAGALAMVASPSTTSARTAAKGATEAGLAAARRFRLLTSRIVAGFVFVAVAHTLISQTRLAVFQRPTDARNPYAYVHSSSDVEKARGLAEAALARAPAGIIRVISEEYWPLPWYFRGLERVGYWTTPPADCDGALIIASESHAEAVRSRLRSRYRESFLGLRPGFLCVVFTPES
jgi:uncharacterized protein (TIGR03663 family)